MPIATPQGTLDFKSVDKVTFVGASSNTVIDTTTGSLGVGVGVGGPTSNLHVVGNTRLEGDIDMLHTSNTAAIKLNSNVVTEFPRSKKLIKYPRVALTQNALNNGYTVIQSGTNGHEPRKAWSLFNNDVTTDDQYHAVPASGESNPYNPSTGAYEPDAGFEDGLGDVAGEYVYVVMPDKIKLQGVSVHPRDGILARSAESARFMGSNNGTTWIDLGGYTNHVWASGSQEPGNFFTVDSGEYYNYIGVVWTKVKGGSGGDTVNMAEVQFFGVPEYDPEAYGTDVVVKSVPNVPNTDWLEVYYDAKESSSYPGTGGTVLDLSGNQINGTLNGNVGFDSEYKAFTFDEADDYITLDTGKTGNYIFSVSLWFKSSGNSIETLFHMNGDYATNNTVWIKGDATSLSIGFVNNDYSCDTGKEIADNMWHHASFVYNGNGESGRDIYLDGIHLGGSLVGSSAGDNLNLTSTSSISRIGALNHSSLGIIHEFKGSIANFRLFNRALSQDEIYQLYAYQKEYFGHGDLSMTLKAGRLGIGTSEPRAALDVLGRIMREYNPGEIIETIQGKANGRYVNVQSGTYLLPNVGNYQDLSGTHTRINGSNFEYTPPPGTTRVIYEFWCFLRQGTGRPIIHFQGRVDDTIVNDSRHTYRDNTDTGFHDPQFWIYNHMCVSIGEVASDNIAGGQVATWNGPRTIDFTAREYSDSYQGRLHMTNHWDGSGDDILVRPTIKITAIA